jgi:hypothetical protein
MEWLSQSICWRQLKIFQALGALVEDPPQTPCRGPVRISSCNAGTPPLVLLRHVRNFVSGNTIYRELRAIGMATVSF